jgi:hypothetical protein
MKSVWIGVFGLCTLLGGMAGVWAQEGAAKPGRVPVAELADKLEVGDVVFIHIGALPFEKVSEATQSWANHVGVVVSVADGTPVIAESRIPRAATTTLAKFVARSVDGRLAIERLGTPLTPEQKQIVLAAANRRLGTVYDAGFNLASHREFCSRFVRDVLGDATGIEVGEVESFRTLLSHNPDTGLWFWRVWFFGRIPWDRQTVTPASVLHSPSLTKVFDGHAG